VGSPMLRATDLARLVVRSRLRAGDRVVDATIGNGHDTLMLADAVGPNGHVYGFDVQADALIRTRARLDDCTHLTLFEAGHERMTELLPVLAQGQIAAIMFNLGYLPSAARHIATRPDTTLTALSASLALVAPGGIVSLVVYPGHATGAVEADAVRAAAAALPAAFCVHHIARLNSAATPPALILIERLF
jgi:predicted methyltransferase